MTLETHWHKRVPDYMAAEYISQGWLVWAIEDTTIIMIWPKEGAPT